MATSQTTSGPIKIHSARIKSGLNEPKEAKDS